MVEFIASIVLVVIIGGGFSMAAGILCHQLYKASIIPTPLRVIIASSVIAVVGIMFMKVMIPLLILGWDSI